MSRLQVCLLRVSSRIPFPQRFTESILPLDMPALNGEDRPGDQQKIKKTLVFSKWGGVYLPDINLKFINHEKNFPFVRRRGRFHARLMRKFNYGA